MFHYLFTNDLRISSLGESLRKAGRCFATNNVPTSAEDKSANNNMMTLGFYFNLTSSSVCAKVAANGDIRAVVLNFIKKFQFPNPRTSESFNDSKVDGIKLAPMRVIVKTLYVLSLLYPLDDAYLTKDEIRDFIFYNSSVAKTANPDIASLISQILQARKTGDSPDSIAPKTDRFWKQEDRQIREMIKVLIWSGCVSEKDGHYVVDNNLLTDAQKAAVFDVINCNSFWSGESVESYRAYMDMEDIDISSNGNLSFAVDLEGNLMSFNRIVFGAPGTGKSYKLEQDRVIFGDNYERVTFHPDYSFAQFVGSYKPVSENGLIEYKYVPGPFIRTLLKAYKNTARQFAEQMDPVFFYSGETEKASFYVAPCNVSDWDYFKNAQYINQIEPWRNPPNSIKVGDVVYIFIGNSGLGIMGYNKDAGVYAVAKVVSEPYVDSNNQSKWVKIQYKALSFSHPIIGEKEFKADNPTNVIQNFQSKPNGEKLLEDLVKPISEPKNYLLLIEEINRANVADVFGDAFQLLDRDDTGKSIYPIECSEDLKKYFISQGLYIERIYIPSNVYIWATMNSADQGVFPMDTAFKRRWDFEYIGINDNENDMKESTVFLGKGDKVHKIKWNDFRHAINDYLSDELKINEDKQLGPYFIGRKTVVPKNGNEIDPIVFNSVFKNKVLMYLFDDAAKQKRASLFAGVEKHNNRYSSICEEFDSKGMYIFNSKICDAVETLKDTDSSSEADNQK